MWDMAGEFRGASDAPTVASAKRGGIGPTGCREILAEGGWQSPRRDAYLLSFTRWFALTFSRRMVPLPCGKTTSISTLFCSPNPK